MRRALWGMAMVLRTLSVQVGTAAWLALAVGATLGFGTVSSLAATQNKIGFELNKLASEGNACQAYFVFDNQGTLDYQELKVDLVVFESDGEIERRFAMQIAPLEAKKRTVKLFELKDMDCDKIGSLLVNGVLECKAGSKSKSDCLDLLDPSSRVDVKLSK